MDQALQGRLLRGIASYCYSWVHMGPPCTSFSSWYRMKSKKCSRTKTNPTGNELVMGEIIGNELGRFCVRVAMLCLQVGVHFTIENPRGSWIWFNDDDDDVHVDDVDVYKMMM
eukprot:2098352-Karenia_brevis.AAC.1